LRLQRIAGIYQQDVAVFGEIHEETAEMIHHYFNNTLELKKFSQPSDKGRTHKVTSPISNAELEVLRQQRRDDDIRKSRLNRIAAPRVSTESHS
jgi:hypothetical protein